ncbi:MAG: hypothetical protein ACREAB_09435 [Blastocatellia bacterium]
MPYGSPYGRMDLTQVMGIGSYVGEVRRGPDGQAYQWVEGVDGLGNTIGFWKGLKKLASKAVPLVTKFIPGIGPVIEQVRGAVKGFCTGLPKLQPVVQQSPDIKPIYQIGTKLCSILSKVGIAGAEDGIMQSPDGQLYEVVEGIGETGEVKKYLRPVWMSIPVVIRPRGARRAMRPAVPGQPAIPAPRPGVPLTPVVPVAPVVTAQPAAPVRRFR